VTGKSEVGDQKSEVISSTSRLMRMGVFGYGRNKSRKDAGMIESLCETCQNLQEVNTPKGSRFLLCRLSKSDPAYPKYPPQPIVRCDGYREKEKIEDHFKT